MRELISFMSIFAFGVANFVAWITAIIHTASNDMIGWLLATVLFPPIGIIYGWILWFT